jgi:hypothetical protein
MVSATFTVHIISGKTILIFDVEVVDYSEHRYLYVRNRAEQHETSLD